MEGFEELDQDRAIRGVREWARVILSCAAIFTLELVVYEAKGWRESSLWWLGTFCGTGAWLIAPYAGIELMLNRHRLTLKQEIIHLVGALGIIGFGVVILLNAFFQAVSTARWILYLMVPLYQWLGIAGTWAISLVAGKTAE